MLLAGAGAGAGAVPRPNTGSNVEVGKLKAFNNSMQIVFEDKDEKYDSRRADSVSVILCVEGISRHLEREYFKGFGSRKFRV